MGLTPRSDNAEDLSQYDPGCGIGRKTRTVIDQVFSKVFIVFFRIITILDAFVCARDCVHICH